MLGSVHDAEDLTQETLLRAWRNLDRFEGRASVRAWLYRIATNACLDELGRRGRRLLPALVGAASSEFVAGQATIDETPWLEPFPDVLFEVPDTAPGPEARYETKEAIELAFISALQKLAPRQRAVLLLRDVLGWSAQDVATLLDVSVAAANSALQRARARLEGSTSPHATRLSKADEQALVERYVQAWEHSDVAAFVALLKQDAVFSMPPLHEWYIGSAAIAAFFTWATGPEGGGPFRYVPTRANNTAALGIYDGAGEPFILQVLEFDGDRIRAMTSFMNPGLFPFFDLPSKVA
jgi:RNA polymerase sigma-70 factor (ECF subfamily)